MRKQGGNFRLNRWATVRAGPASTASLLAQIDAMEPTLARHMPWEFERWGYGDEKPYEAFVDELRSNVVRRLQFLDERYAQH
jgi:hypothetical protein